MDYIRSPLLLYMSFLSHPPLVFSVSYSVAARFLSAVPERTMHSLSSVSAGSSILAWAWFWAWGSGSRGDTATVVACDSSHKRGLKELYILSTHPSPRGRRCRRSDSW